jgi:hypothetical protein
MPVGSSPSSASSSAASGVGHETPGRSPLTGDGLPILGESDGCIAFGPMPLTGDNMDKTALVASYQQDVDDRGEQAERQSQEWVLHFAGIKAPEALAIDATAAEGGSSGGNDSGSNGDAGSDDVVYTAFFPSDVATTQQAQIEAALIQSVERRYNRRKTTASAAATGAQVDYDHIFSQQVFANPTAQADADATNIKRVPFTDADVAWSGCAYLGSDLSAPQRAFGAWGYTDNIQVRDSDGILALAKSAQQTFDELAETGRTMTAGASAAGALVTVDDAGDLYIVVPHIGDCRVVLVEHDAPVGTSDKTFPKATRLTTRHRPLDDKARLNGVTYEQKPATSSTKLAALNVVTADLAATGQVCNTVCDLQGNALPVSRSLGARVLRDAGLPSNTAFSVHRIAASAWSEKRFDVVVTNKALDVLPEVRIAQLASTDVYKADPANVLASAAYTLNKLCDGKAGNGLAMVLDLQKLQPQAGCLYHAFAFDGHGDAPVGEEVDTVKMLVAAFPERLRENMAAAVALQVADDSADDVDDAGVGTEASADTAGVKPAEMQSQFVDSTSEITEDLQAVAIARVHAAVEHMAETSGVATPAAVVSADHRASAVAPGTAARSRTTTRVDLMAHQPVSHKTNALRLIARVLMCHDFYVEDARLNDLVEVIPGCVARGSDRNPIRNNTHGRSDTIRALAEEALAFYEYGTLNDFNDLNITTFEARIETEIRKIRVKMLGRGTTSRFAHTLEDILDKDHRGVSGQTDGTNYPGSKLDAGLPITFINQSEAQAESYIQHHMVHRAASFFREYRGAYTARQFKSTSIDKVNTEGGFRKALSRLLEASHRARALQALPQNQQSFGQAIVATIRNTMTKSGGYELDVHGQGGLGRAFDGCTAFLDRITPEAVVHSFGDALTQIKGTVNPQDDVIVEVPAPS